LGIFLLSFGSNILVNGSQTLATLLGVNEIVIGLTIVATGTSLPELVTSIIAAFKGKTDLAIGNVIGSNLLNQLLILGSCSIFSGFKGLLIEQSLIKVDLPFMVLTTFACLPIFWTKGKITRIEGFILINFVDNYGYQLSGGERRRCEIARALTVGRKGPKYLLLDEPFAGIDPLAVNDLKKLILKLSSDGVGILITDHNVRETLLITNKSYVLSEGKIIANGSSRELADNPIVKKYYLGDNFKL